MTILYVGCPLPRIDGTGVMAWGLEGSIKQAGIEEELDANLPVLLDVKRPHLTPSRSPASCALDIFLFVALVPSSYSLLLHTIIYHVLLFLANVAIASLCATASLEADKGLQLLPTLIFSIRVFYCITGKLDKADMVL